MKSFPTFDIENEIIDNFYLSPLVTHDRELIIAGVDEAGRGPLCGPVVAAAVIFKSDAQYPQINDSKQMTHAQRSLAYDWIMENCLVGIGQCSPVEIDELNILHASMLAMKRAIADLSKKPDFCLVDGNRMPDNLISAPLRKGNISSLAQFDYISQMSGNTIIGRAVVKGDSKSLSIAAASIIAKETRDKIMHELAAQFPQYGWDKNAGYPTAAHLQAIKEFGINQHYRKSYKPVKDLL
ncbi:MAG: ribonuclease HII [Alphaproteobacteria bacterium]|nr:ribonuclease HII [Alphaproteobacteria bacterium]